MIPMSSLCIPPLSPHSHTFSSPNKHSLYKYPIANLTHSLQFQSHVTIQSYRKITNYQQKGVIWGRKQGFGVEELGGEDVADEDDEEEEEDRSLDLLVRFVQNMFKKVSKRARRAVRSVLPVAISPELVGFSVNGMVVLAFLWVLKAFLEVVCTLGSVVFVSILLIRGVWSGVSYLQDTRSYKDDEFDSERRPWNGAQPAS